MLSSRMIIIMMCDDDDIDDDDADNDTGGDDVDIVFVHGDNRTCDVDVHVYFHVPSSSYPSTVVLLIFPFPFSSDFSYSTFALPSHTINPVALQYDESANHHLATDVRTCGRRVASGTPVMQRRPHCPPADEPPCLDRPVTAKYFRRPREIAFLNLRLVFSLVLCSSGVVR